MSFQILAFVSNDPTYHGDGTGDGGTALVAIPYLGYQVKDVSFTSYLPIVTPNIERSTFGVTIG